MSDLKEQLEANMDVFKHNSNLFLTNGNSSAGTRATKALNEISKIAKAIRKEILEAKKSKKK